MTRKAHLFAEAPEKNCSACEIYANASFLCEPNEHKTIYLNIKINKSRIKRLNQCKKNSHLVVFAPDPVLTNKGLSIEDYEGGEAYFTQRDNHNLFVHLKNKSDKTIKIDKGELIGKTRLQKNNIPTLIKREIIKIGERTDILFAVVDKNRDDIFYIFANQKIELHDEQTLETNINIMQKMNEIHEDYKTTVNTDNELYQNSVIVKSTQRNLHNLCGCKYSLQIFNRSSKDIVLNKNDLLCRIAIEPL